MSNPNVISGSDYMAIATYYGDIVTQLSGIGNYLYLAVDQVVLMSNYCPTLDLLDPFNNVYTAGFTSYASFTAFLPAVKALNSHIMNRGAGTYTSVGGIVTNGVASVDPTSFLAQNGFVGLVNGVPPSWATLSALAGTPIYSGYIA